MYQNEIIRALKDAEYRNSLSKEQFSQLPENPAGVIEISDEESKTEVGGRRCRGITCGFFCKGFRGTSAGVICSAAGICF